MFVALCAIVVTTFARGRQSTEFFEGDNYDGEDTRVPPPGIDGIQEDPDADELSPGGGMSDNGLPDATAYDDADATEEAGIEPFSGEEYGAY